MTAARLTDLNNTERGAPFSKNYSLFVKIIRYALPLIAIGLVVIVITWSEMDDQMVAIPKENIIPDAAAIIGQTELTNPRFETVDELNQPINIVADKALQSQDSPDVINLTNPIADFKTEQGNAMTVRAEKGIMEQEEEKLFLQNNVQITHDGGYVLKADELRLNMKSKQAFSDKNVTITSEGGEIKAQGLDGNMEDGILIFKGPATLIINDAEQENLL